jgi:hypothetical protein
MGAGVAAIYNTERFPHPRAALTVLLGTLVGTWVALGAALAASPY